MRYNYVSFISMYPRYHICRKEVNTNTTPYNKYVLTKLLVVYNRGFNLSCCEQLHYLTTKIN